MEKNPWEGLEDSSYVLEDKGRAAVFLVPSRGFHREMRDALERYMQEQFGGFQRPDTLVSGVYTTDDGTVVLDKCIQYEVAFLGKERIPGLARVLSNMARMLGEECLYFKAGQRVAMLRPRDVS